MVTANAVTTRLLNTSGLATVGTTLAVGTSATIGTTLDVTGNTTAGNLVTANAVTTRLLNTSGLATIGTTLDVTGNTTAGNLVTANAVTTRLLNTSGLATIGTSLAVGTSATVGTTLIVTGNTTAGNLVTANAVTTRLLNTSGLATVGTTLAVGTSATIGTTLDVTGNTTAGNLVTANAVTTRLLNTSGLATIGTSLAVGTTLDVTGNTTVGNLNTANAVTAGILVATNRADIGQLSAAGATLGFAEVTGSLVVGGNFTIQGQTLVDTDTVKIRSATKQTIGAGVGTGFVINRANSSATVNGTNDIITSNGHGFTDGQNVSFISLSTGVTGLSNNTIYRVVQKTDNTFKVASVGAFPIAIDFSTSGLASATLRDMDNPDGQIRWNEVGRYWDLRDVGNTVDATAYSKILTANLISNTLTSTSADTVLSSQGANTLDTRIVTANTNLKNYVDVANTSMKSYVDTANTNLKSYTDNLVSTANTNLKSYTDNLVSTANTNLKNYVDVENLKPVTVLAANLANLVTTVTLATFRANTAGANLQNLVIEHIRETAGSNTEGTYDRISRQIGAEGTTVQGQIKLRDSTLRLHGLGKHPVALAPDSSTGDSFAIDYYGRVHVGVPLGGTTPARAFNISTTEPAIGFLDSLSGLNPASSRYSYIDANNGNLAFFADTFQTQTDSAITFAVDTSTTAVRILPSDTAATSTSTGTMVVTGGVGISGAAFVGGSLSVAGDLLVSGTTTTINTAQLNIADNEFVLNSDLANNVLATESAGITVNRGANTNTYIRWNETTDTWVANNGITSGEFRLANTTTYLTEGTNLYLTASRVRANVGNTAPILYDSSNGVFSHATSGVTTATHGSSTSVPVFIVNAEGHVTSVTNTSIAFPIQEEADTLATVTGRGANTATAITINNTTAATSNSTGALILKGGISGNANARFDAVFDAGSRVISSVSNTAPIIATVSANTLSISHATSGVTAATHGSSIAVPVFVVNTEGHVTSVTNTSIRAASTTQTGIVQLESSVTSTSTSNAAVPASVRTAYNHAEAAFASSNTKPTSITISNGTGISGGGTGNTFTLSIGQAVGTTNNLQFRTIGVGTAADTANAGSIIATGDITSSFSDDRLKTKLGNIENALSKVEQLSGFYYEANEIAQELGYTAKREVGVSAQQVQGVMPEVIAPAAIDQQYLTVKYDRMVPLLIEAIKELKQQVDDIKNQLNNQ